MMQMPDDLRIQIIHLSEDIAKQGCRLHAHMGHALKALCIPESSSTASQSARAVHATSDAVGSKVKADLAASPAQDVGSSSSYKGAPASAAGVARQHALTAPDSINAGGKAAAKPKAAIAASTITAQGSKPSTRHLDQGTPSDGVSTAQHAASAPVVDSSRAAAEPAFQACIKACGAQQLCCSLAAGNGAQEGGAASSAASI